MSSSQCGEIDSNHLTEGLFSLGNVLSLYSFRRCMTQCCKSTFLVWKTVLCVFLGIQTYNYKVASRESLPLILMVDRYMYSTVVS